jgi:hypothetical protein
MLPGGGQKHEEMTQAQILDFGGPGALVPGASPFGDVQAIAVDQLGIDGGRIFARRDVARDIKPVAVRDVGDGQLLDEPGDGRGFTAIHGWPPFLGKSWELFPWAQVPESRKILQQFRADCEPRNVKNKPFSKPLVRAGAQVFRRDA